MKVVKKIDIHVHTSESGWLARLPADRCATPEELMAMYDTLGVERGVIMPGINIEGGFNTTSNYEIYRVVQKYPDRFAWFCNVDPRQGSNSPETDFTPYLEFCRDRGARGVGEVCANLTFDDPKMLNLLWHCERCGMPVTFHIGSGEGDYGVIDDFGLPRLEKALAAFPKLRFMGHSQKFWAELSGDLRPEDRDGYPTGKVVPGGRVVELMRKYPNLCGDLSAGSGYNALSRDPDFGYAFLEEFSDRLYYGTDICSPTNLSDSRIKLSSFLDGAMLQGKISYDTYVKVSRANAEKLLGIND